VVRQDSEYGAPAFVDSLRQADRRAGWL